MSHATGPGALTTDGCAVDMYALLPTFGEPELIHDALAAGASVLDLGSGVGRIADPLVELGHPVVAVDDSADMLDRVRRARTVHSRIEDLRLEARFDAVLMASHLANKPDAEALFAAARRHLADGGTVFVQWHTPEWFDRQRPGAGAPYQLGPVRSVLEIHSVDGDLLTATVAYRYGDLEWTQDFQARRLDVDGLRAEFARHGLVLDRFLTEDRSWVCAREAS
jgi:SAM-dependent methyltransferase